MGVRSLPIGTLQLFATIYFTPREYGTREWVHVQPTSPIAVLPPPQQGTISASCFIRSRRSRCECSCANDLSRFWESWVVVAKRSGAPARSITGAPLRFAPATLANSLPESRNCCGGSDPEAAVAVPIPILASPQKNEAGSRRIRYP